MQKVKLGEFITLNYGKGLPERNRVRGDIPVYSSSGLTGWHNASLVDTAGIIVGRKGSIGTVYLSKNPFYCIDTAYYIIPNGHLYDLEFIYYQLKTLGLGNLNEDSAVPGLNRDTVYDQLIYLPDIKIQKKISSFLDTLDNKINLLKKQNTSLEELAKTYFLNNEKSFLNSKGILADYVEFDPRENIDRNREYRFFDMKTLSEDSFSIGNGIYRSINSASSFRNFDTLLAKITPCLENGKTGFVMNLESNEVARGSTEFIVMRSKGSVSPYWIYCLARSKNFRDEAIQSMTGSSGRQRVQVSQIKNFEVSFNKDDMSSFHKTCTVIFDKLKKNSIQMQTLANLRDLLLPKLMSGEIQVN